MGIRWGKWRAALAVVALGVGVLVSPAQAAAPARKKLSYVAMGDSYTSGPLVLPHDQRWVPQGCGQSSRNYPHLINDIMRPTAFRDVSCGGATIDDFSKPQDVVTGIAKPQYDALNKSTDVVTVGIGGNDVGFVGLALDCIRAAPQPIGRPSCQSENKIHGVDQTANEIAVAQSELGAALDHIHALSPHAAVFVISYPDALPNTGAGCYPYIPIRDSDMHYLLRMFKAMNAMLKAAANAHGAHYVDIYTPSIGHDICKPPALAWVNGAVLVPPSFPAHPNDLSFLHSAPVIVKAIQRQLPH